MLVFSSESLFPKTVYVIKVEFIDTVMSHNLSKENIPPMRRKMVEIDAQQVRAEM